MFLRLYATLREVEPVGTSNLETVLFCSEETGLNSAIKNKETAITMPAKVMKKYLKKSFEFNFIKLQTPGFHLRYKPLFPNDIHI